MAQSTVAVMRGWILVGVIAAILAAGCSSSAGDADASARGDGSTAAAESVSPLIDLIGFSSDTELNRDRFLAIQAESDDQVADCMAAQGFIWQPSAPPPGSALAPGNRMSLAWARAHGLGVTDQITSLAQAPIADPNDAYIATLADADVERWETTLWGDTSSLVSDADEPVLYAPAGCLGAAYAVSRDAFEVFQQFEPELVTLDKRIKADPRIVTHQERWASCMQAAGHPFTDVESMRSDVFGRLLAISGVEQVMTGAGQPQDVDQGALGELVALERTIAVAHVECSAPTLLEAADIRDTYERQFIIDHRSRLEAAAG